MLIKPLRYLLGCLALLGGTIAGAQDLSLIASMRVGQVLSTEQLSALGKMPSIDIDGQTYLVVPVQGGDSSTTLIDSSRRLGRTENQVSIVEQPTDKVRSQLAGLLGRAASVKYYDHMNITLVRYVSIQQAVQGLADLRAAMPGAAIGLPVSFSQRKIQ